MFRDKLKKVIDKDACETGNNKKKIENLVFFVIILIITLIFINSIWNSNDKKTKEEIKINTKQLATEETNEQQLETQTNNSDLLEKKLENILSKIEGVGMVNVCINYSESSEIIAMYNENSKISTTEESDDSGGTRKVQENDTQKDIVYKEDNGTKTPITQKVIEPRIEGAIIIAKGANNIDTKSNIIQAVEAVTGLATHKIQVFEMN